MRRLVSKLTVGAAMVCGVLLIALPQVSAVGRASSVDVGTLCASEQHSWSGNTTLGASEAFFTGVSVAAEAGTELTVTAVAASTDEGSSALVVQVGDSATTQGAATNGGGISVVNSGADTVHVTSIDVIVNRCQQVASAAAQSAPQVSVEVSRAKSAVLPTTGAASTGLMTAAVLVTVLGLAMVVIGRRRRQI